MDIINIHLPLAMAIALPTIILCIGCVFGALFERWERKKEVMKHEENLSIFLRDQAS